MELSASAQSAVQAAIGFQFEGDPIKLEEFQDAWGDDPPPGFVREDDEVKTSVKAKQSVAETKRMENGTVDLNLKVETFTQSKTSDPGANSEIEMDLGLILIESRDILIRP